MTVNLDLALKIFAAASAYIEHAGLSKEVEWQRSRRFPEFSESDFLRETAWVILCTGFREAIVRKVFNHVSLSFCDWESSSAIVTSAPACHATAMAAFRNERKLKAILQTARYLDHAGFDTVKRRVLENPIPELRKLPYIGPITVWHLAKNLGFDVAKPDRHLVRLCSWVEYTTPQDLCSIIATETGNSISVVDTVLWRYVADCSAEARRICRRAKPQSRLAAQLRATPNV
jgi:hypothetical protein